MGSTADKKIRSGNMVGRNAQTPPPQVRRSAMMTGGTPGNERTGGSVDERTDETGGEAMLDGAPTFRCRRTAKV